MSVWANDLIKNTVLGAGKGVVSGLEPVFAFGELQTGGAAVNILLWPVTGITAVPVHASGVQMSLVSGNAADAAAGTGIRKVTIVYLDGNLDQQTEEVTLNGTSAVTTVATDIRFIQCTFGSELGSGGRAAGAITISNGGTTYSYVAATARRCSSSARMVPRRKRLVVKTLSAGAIAAAAEAKGLIRFSTSKVYNSSFASSGLLFPIKSFGVQDSTACVLDFDYVAGEGEIVAFEASAAADVLLVGSWSGWFEDAY